MPSLVVQKHTELFKYRSLTNSEIEQYHDEGYLRIGQVLTDRGLEDLKKEVMAAWESEKGPFNSDANWLKNSLLPNIHHQSDLVRKYYFNGPLVEVAQQVISPNIKSVTSQLTFKMRGNTMPFGWHQDNGYGELEPYTTISSLTAFDDTDQDNGCLRIIPGSHKAGQIAVDRSPEDRKANKEVVVEADDTKSIPLYMRAGESVIFHCWMLHKSEANHSKTRDRRLLFQRYANANAVEVYNNRQPRLGRLLRGTTKFPEVEAFEADLL